MVVVVVSAVSGFEIEINVVGRRKGREESDGEFLGHGRAVAGIPCGRQFERCLLGSLVVFFSSAVVLFPQDS